MTEALVAQRYEELGLIMTGKMKLKDRDGRIPAGGISLSAAERKYGINNETLSKWARQGYIPVLLRTANEVFIDEKRLAIIAKRWKEDAGRGKWTIRKIIKELETTHS